MIPIIPAHTQSFSCGNFRCNDEGIFAFGHAGGSIMDVSLSNLVSNEGIVASDVTGVGTARHYLAATEFGEDKGIFGFGVATYTNVSLSNKVSNTGVVATDTTGVGTARQGLAACGYGEDKGIFGFGRLPNYNYTSITNLVSNVGAVSSDVTGVGSSLYLRGACEYGGDKGIFGFGHGDSSPIDLRNTAITNLVSNTGVVASDTAGVGTGRRFVAACGYGGDKGIFAFGRNGNVSTSNLVSNTGVVASDTAGAAGTTARHSPEGCEFGGGEAIFAFGELAYSPYRVSITNLVSNEGVVASDTAGVSGVQARRFHGGCSFN